MCGISQKTLTERLRELEAHGAVERSREGGDAVLYALTPRGRDLARLLDELAEWGEQTLTPPVIAPPPPRRRTSGTGPSQGWASSSNAGGTGVAACREVAVVASGRDVSSFLSGRYERSDGATADSDGATAGSSTSGS